MPFSVSGVSNRKIQRVFGLENLDLQSSLIADAISVSVPEMPKNVGAYNHNMEGEQ